jgi:hypothetical protein
VPQRQRERARRPCRPSGSIQTVPFDIQQPDPVPHIALIETWQLTAFLGDYGLGQTVAAESLMPGERKTVSMQTWSADTSNKEQSTSVFDSADSSAQDRFGKQVTAAGNTTTTESGGVAASIGTKTGASAQVYIVNMSGEIEASTSANYQKGRQDFSSNVDTATNEHANQCNSSRRTAVGEVTKTQREEGTIGQTTRELSNTKDSRDN